MAENITHEISKLLAAMLPNLKKTRVILKLSLPDNRCYYMMTVYYLIYVICLSSLNTICIQ